MPVRDIDLEATGGPVVRLSWSEPDAGSSRVFYKLFRSPAATDYLCFTDGSGADRCTLVSVELTDAAKDERGRPAGPGHVDVQGGRGGQLGRRSRARRRLPPLEPRHRHGSLTSRRWLGEALGLAGLLAVAALVYSRGVDAAANYDEGVYLASLDALRHGQELGTDVYASQPPGFYVLLQGLSLLPGDGVEGIRVAFVLVALLGLVAAYAIGRKLAGVWGAFGAAALLALTAPWPVQAARVQADTASVALSLCAIAVAFYAGRCPWRWAATGALARGCDRRQAARPSR